METTLENRVQRFVDQRRLSRAAHARNADECAQGNTQGNVFQIMSRAAFQFKPLTTAWPTHLRNVEFRATGEIVGSGSRLFQKISRFSNVDDLAAVFACTRTEIDQIIGFQHDVPVVLYHQYRIANIAQVFERAYEPVIVALVKPDARLIQNISDARELRTDLSSEADALAFTAGERAGWTVERQVIKTNL